MFAQLKVNPNNGLGDVYDKIKGHAAEAEVIADIEKQYETRPGKQIANTLQISLFFWKKSIGRIHFIIVVIKDLIYDGRSRAEIRQEIVNIWILKTKHCWLL